MENQEMNTRFWNKRKIMLIAAVVCCVMIVAAGTLAYFTAEEKAFNKITTGRLEMLLHDETTGGVAFPEGGIENVMPGDVVDKLVAVENTGSVDFYTRVKVEKIIVAADEKTELSFENITLDINDEYWTEKDGYYYYKEAVKPGKTTEPLFTTVTFGTELGNEYMSAHVEVNVSAQAVQSKNNGSSALEADGWTET